MNTQKRPNILLIMSDEHGAWATGAYGHPAVKTPHIDSLAANGVTFDSAYCNSPVCGPSRMSFMTGQLPSKIEAWDNGKPLPSDIPTWAHSLTVAGYQTVLAGKMHFQGPDLKHGFELRIGKEQTDTRIKPGSFDVLRGHHDPSHYLKHVGIGRNLRADSDEEMARRASDFLRGGEGRDPDRPFALCVSFFIPHFPLLADEESFGLYWPEHADLPDMPPDFLNRMHPAWKALRTYYNVDGVSHETIRRARAAYYGLITHMDRLVGQVMSVLRESGEADNTIVVYTSDHGEHVGNHGLWWKRSFFEESVRVPLVISWPGRYPTGERRSEVVSLVDLSATLLDWAGAKDELREYDGRSLDPVLRGAAPDWPDVALSEYYGSDEAFGMPDSWLARQPRRMVRKGRYKLNYFVGAEPELYNLESDPGEWQDLVRSSEHADLVTSLVRMATADWDGDVLGRAAELSRRRRKLVLQAERVYLGPTALTPGQTYS